MATYLLKDFHSIAKVGDKITYADDLNFMSYKIIEIFDNGFSIEATNNNCNVEKGDCEDLHIATMQHGWQIWLTHFQIMNR
jgi:hypothetical protein